MEDQIDPLYQKGFNAGYLINEHEPELLNKVLQSKNDSGYFKALVAGKQQQEWDVAFNEIHQASQNLKEHSKDRGIDD